MKKSSEMAVFVQVVESRGFSAAARALNVSPAAVSKQIGRLEDRLGVRLLNRDSRGVSLTEAGRVYYESSSRIVSEIAEAEQSVALLTDRVQGTLRVVSTVAFGKAHLLPLLPAFLEHHDGLRVMLELTDRPVDLVEGAVDVAIRFTEQVTESSLVARQLAVNRRVLCAAPSYLERHGMPRSVDDLLQHNCLKLYTVGRFNDWEFPGPAGPRVLPVRGNFEANSADAVYQAVLAGLGIARPSVYLVAADIRSGRLVRLLPDYVQEEAAILAVYPHRRHLLPKVRAFIDFLVEAFQPMPPWERSRR